MTKALGWAAAAALISLSSAWLLSRAIEGGGYPEETAHSGDLPEMVALGGKLYGLSCSQCHDDDATGDEGPNLRRLPVSNAFIAVTIKHGIKGEMTSFSKKYNDQEVKALVLYLRSLP